MKKSAWFFYFKNSISYLIFSCLKPFFLRKGSKAKRILFINTGQIGDLLISSTIFLNVHLFKDYEVFFLVKEKYRELYNDYNGPIKLITWNYLRYKFNLFYRINFLRQLKSLGFELCVNLTSARGMINDELSLLSGAVKVYCTNSDWKYLKKYFGKKMDSIYDGAYSFNLQNEYEKHIKIIEHLTSNKAVGNTGLYIKNQTFDKARTKLRKIVGDKKILTFITVAPFTNLQIKNWNFENYKELCMKLVEKYDVPILLIGNKLQRKSLEEIKRLIPDMIINTAGHFSLLESAALVKLSLIFIGNDSGFTHIAKALRKKFIGIIGGASYGIYFPYNLTSNEILLFYPLDCFGCKWNCIFDKPYCHHNITVENVLEKCSVLMSQED